jgi:hypothetical protein
MDKKEREEAIIELMADHVHERAELACTLYEKEDRLYRREDLQEVVDLKDLEAARTIAKIFIQAARLRDAERLAALFELLWDRWEARRKHRALSRPDAWDVGALGVSSADFLRRETRYIRLLHFLCLEIMAVAFILELGEQDGGDDGGSTATYLVEMLPGLRPPCPIAQYEGDDDQEDEYAKECQR